MTLTAVGVDPTLIYPGQSVSYDLTIILPTLSENTPKFTVSYTFRTDSEDAQHLGIVLFDMTHKRST